jgi:hypothetical protein
MAGALDPRGRQAAEDFAHIWLGQSDEPLSATIAAVESDIECMPNMVDAGQSHRGWAMRILFGRARQLRA